MTITKPLQDLYTKYVHVEKSVAYPWLDRAISYVAPTAGVVLFSALGDHNTKKPDGSPDYTYAPFTKDYSAWGLPASLAFYAGTQTLLTYAKPYAAKIGNKYAHKAADLTLKVLDTVNNVAPYTVAYNMLPKTAGVNAVYAFKTLPSIIKGVESDIKNAINHKPFEKEVAGEIYASTTAGLISANIARYAADHFAPESQKDKATDRNIIESITDAFSYAIGKKLLIGKSYKENEFKSEVLRTGVQTFVRECKFLDINYGLDQKDSVFEGIIKNAGSELFMLALDESSELLETSDELGYDLKEAAKAALQATADSL